MVVKSKIGRNRYILFQIVSKESIGYQRMNAILKKLPTSLQLVEVKNGYGIVRCSHKDKDSAIQLLNNLKYANIQTITTTGSVKKVRASIRGHHDNRKKG